MGSSQITAHTVNDLFAAGQIRLAELSVYNWGSFHGLHSARIDPQGTLITGDNGSGKSTFIDGLMALLLPAGKATFNVAAAQGDKSDRSLISYMRGSYGSTHDGGATRVKSKREGGVVSALRALYRADDGSEITLTALFWTLQPSNALEDVNRIYAVAKRKLHLKEVLDAFGEGNARSLKQWMRNDESISCCDKNFSEYQALYRKLLFMENKNAPALLSRALGLKKIDDLTHLIRQLVLEPSGVRDDARQVVEEFSDLVAIHDKLLDARQQSESLAKLPHLDNTINTQQAKLNSLGQEKFGIPAYFGEVLVKLWQARIDTLQREQQTLELTIKQQQTAKQEAENLVERRHADYLQLGGNQIELLKKELDNTLASVAQIVKSSSKYQALARQLNLNDSLDEAVFIKNQQTAELKLKHLEQDTQEKQNHFAEVSGHFSRAQNALKTTHEEINAIRARPNSNIDLRFQQMRDELVQALNLAADQCLFIGELVDVKDQEKPWQGAIERALGGLRTTLAVPEQSYSMVTQWLNARHTGLHVRVQVVRDSKVKTPPPRFKENGFLKKLVWREHPYREWLKHHLQRFDLLCVAGTAELDVTPFSMTQQGLIHKEKGRFEKMDKSRVDDRREWQLGFSNKTRLALLQSQVRELDSELAQYEQQVKAARSALNQCAVNQNNYQQLVEFTWDSIDLPRWQKKLTHLKADLQRLQSARGNLEDARNLWQQAKQAREEIVQQLQTLHAEQGGLSNQRQAAEKAYKQAAADAQQGLSDSCRQALNQRLDPIALDDLDKISSLRSDTEKRLDELLEKAQNSKNTAENSAVGVMSSFRGRDKWQALCVDWPVGLAALPDFLDHLEQLQKEGLPALVEQFVERLNKHATQSLARIKSRLDAEREDIIDRIEVINRVLKRTEFKQGSYLRLGSRKEKFAHVQEFDKQLNLTLSQVTSSDHEQRFLQLDRVVTILEKASAANTAGNLESLRLLDPRYQLSFYAEEIGFEQQEIRDVLDSSSGKSGGEKESFAGTIVAASLAYVLTPEGYDKPIYSSVFLDEAFSNTAEAVSRRVLRVFKALNIHVNLITPYKNLNLARESAQSLLIAERDPKKHESHLCEITWQEVDRRLEQQQQAQLKRELDAHNIEIEAGYSLE